MTMNTTRTRPPVVIADDHTEIKIYTTESRGRALYQVCYYESGRRERKSYIDMAEAKREARMILGRLAGLRAAARNVTGAEIESLISAQRALSECGVPIHLAAQEYAEARRILGPVELLNAVRQYAEQHYVSAKRRPIGELITEYAQWLRDSALSHPHVQTVWTHLKQFESAFTGKLLADLAPQEMDAWLQSKSNWSPVSRSNVRRALVTFGNWAKRQGYLHPERRTVFDAMLKPKLATKGIEILTPDDLRKFFAASKDSVTPYLAIAAFAGLRTAEILRLDWKEIHLDRGFIEVAAEKAKTRSRRLVPICDNLAAWLRLHQQNSGPVVPYARVFDAQEFLIRRTGLTWKKNALRHSYISYRLAIVPDTARVALECGNSPEVIFKCYREVVTATEAKEWFGIMPA